MNICRHLLNINDSFIIERFMSDRGRYVNLSLFKQFSRQF